MAKVPEKIDKYVVEDLVASGGMGAVYRGVHPTLDRKVILKKLTLRGNKTVTERFRREARILTNFRNDYIVDVYDHLVEGRSHYIVMEYVEGMSVRGLLDEQRYLDNASAAYIALGTALALEYAHSKSVVHRDIKPGNILLSKEGEVKLADFGIASSGERESDDKTLTSDGMTLGTPAYMAPEQFENSKKVDFRADIYSLGVMLYEMLVGAKPYSGGFSPEVIQQIQKGKFKKPRRVNPSVSPELQKIIIALMKVKPGHRIKTMREVIQKLQTFLGKYKSEDIQKRLASLVNGSTPPALQQLRRPPGVLSIISACLVSLFFASLVGAIFYLGIPKALFYPATQGRLQVDIFGDDIPEIIVSSAVVVEGEKPLNRIPVFMPNLQDRGSARSALPLFLPVGEYFVKSSSPGKTQIAVVSIAPIAEGQKTVVVNFTLSPNTLRSVEIQAHTMASSSLIQVQTDVRSLDNGETPENYTPLARALSAGQIFSPGTYGFRIRAAGYEEIVIEIEFEPGDMDVVLDVELRKLQ